MWRSVPVPMLVHWMLDGAKPVSVLTPTLSIPGNSTARPAAFGHRLQVPGGPRVTPTPDHHNQFRSYRAALVLRGIAPASSAASGLRTSGPPSIPPAP